MQLEPFLKSTIVSLKDEVPEDEEAVSSALDQLQTTLQNVQDLQIKLKVKNRPVIDPIFQAEVSSEFTHCHDPYSRAERSLILAIEIDHQYKYGFHEQCSEWQAGLRGRITTNAVGKSSPMGKERGA